MLVVERKAVCHDRGKEIVGKPAGERGVSVIGDSAQHWPHQRALKKEAVVGINAVTQHGRHCLAAHLDVVIVR